MLRRRPTTSPNPKASACCSDMDRVVEMLRTLGVPIERQHTPSASKSDQQFWRSMIWSSVCGAESHESIRTVKAFLNIILIKVFIKRKILSVETIPNAYI